MYTRVRDKCTRREYRRCQREGKTKAKRSPKGHLLHFRRDTRRVHGGAQYGTRLIETELRACLIEPGPIGIRGIERDALTGTCLQPCRRQRKSSQSEVVRCRRTGGREGLALVGGSEGGMDAPFFLHGPLLDLPDVRQPLNLRAKGSCNMSLPQRHGVHLCHHTRCHACIGQA